MRWRLSRNELPQEGQRVLMYQKCLTKGTRALVCGYYSKGYFWRDDVYHQWTDDWSEEVLKLQFKMRLTGIVYWVPEDVVLAELPELVD